MLKDVANESFCTNNLKVKSVFLNEKKNFQMSFFTRFKKKVQWGELKKKK